MATDAVIPNSLVLQEDYLNAFCVRLPSTHIVLVSTEDAELVLRYRWHASGSHLSEKYANTWLHTQGKKTSLRMQNLIMQPPSGFQVDHINGDRLDNRRTNLRLCTPLQNQFNKRGKTSSTSRFKGVSWRKGRGHWKVAIFVNDAEIYLGSSRNEIKAALIYNEAAKRYFGEFAWLNQI